MKIEVGDTVYTKYDKGEIEPMVVTDITVDVATVICADLIETRCYMVKDLVKG